MRPTTRQLTNVALLVAVCASLSLFVQITVRAQSTDLGSPTPVYSNEITGRIAPLDLGDPRQTRHFYTFNARPGDLELTVEADNLDGDIELFTASAMRPLVQITLYSGLGSNVTRTVFFRAGSAVILRVQARSPNDSEGTYRIRLGGTFAPSTLPPPAESASETATPAREKPAGAGTRRVNSIGARIEEPKIETLPTTESAEAAPTPSETPVTTPTPATTVKSTRNSASSRTTPARRGAARRSTTPRATTPTGETSKTESANAEPGKTETKTETAKGGDRASAETPPDEPATPAETARTTTRTNRARANRARGPRANAGGASTTNAANSSESSSGSAAKANESSASSSPASSAPPAAGTTGLEAPGARLVLEMRDGTRIERAMSDVRRFAVEGRLVVIVLKDGQVERHPLWNVQRMSIEP